METDTMFMNYAGNNVGQSVKVSLMVGVLDVTEVVEIKLPKHVTLDEKKKCAEKLAF